MCNRKLAKLVLTQCKATYPGLRPELICCRRTTEVSAISVLELGTCTTQAIVKNISCVTFWN